MTIVQWVNLEKDEAYAKDSDIGSVDRCGALSLKALFEKDGVPLNFTVRAVPSGGDNVQYNEEEQKRNPNFRMPTEVIGLGSEKEVLLEDSVKLPAAGGNKYKLEAKDANGTTVESVEVEAKRKLYYQYMYMDDSNGAVTPHPLTQLESHGEDNYVVITKAGDDKKIAFHKTIAMTGEGTFHYGHFTNMVAASYDLPDPLKRVGCVTVLSNYIASMFSSGEIQISQTIGSPANPLCVISADTVTLEITGNYYLWHGLDDIDDAKNRWFVRCRVEYMPKNGTGPDDVTTVQIDGADVDPSGQPAFTYGGYKKFAINIGPDLKALTTKTDGTLRFIFEVNLASFTGGFSYGGGGFQLTTCCTKSWWRDVKPARADQIWNHEIGHRMGMVAYGDKDHRATNPKYFSYKPKLPDAPSTLYGENRKVNDKGHAGPHCESGVSFDSSTKKWSGAPKCVMFGATATSDGSAPLEYCDECKPIVRKLDLSF